MLGDLTMARHHGHAPLPAGQLVSPPAVAREFWQEVTRRRKACWQLCWQQ